jgi:polyisoprenyl-phosphate glycosyltransferase
MEAKQTDESVSAPAVISIVIPVFNCEEFFPLLERELEALEGPLRELGLRPQIIFVDDGSTDASLRCMLEVRDRRDDTTIVKLTRNFGAPAAVKTGYQFVIGDVFLAIAADLQDPFDKIPEMARHWRNGSKFTILVRQNREDPMSSKIFSWLYYRLIRTVVFSNYPKTGFDVSMMDKCMLESVKDTAKNINPSLFAHYLGFSPKILFYNRKKRIYGSSGWSVSKKVKYFLDSILGFSIAPCRWITLIGLIVALGSFVYGVFILVSVYFTGSSVPGFPSIVTLVAFLSGTNLLVSGMIAEYVWRVFDEINKRPEYVVDEIYSA